MRLESEIEQLYALGGEPVGISVDPPARNAAMVGRWHLSFPIASDPGGERFLHPLDLWDDRDPRQIGIPAVIVLGPDGEEAWQHRSRDFADRPDDADVMRALESLHLPPLDPPRARWQPDLEAEEHPGAFRTDAFGAYHRGVMFAMAAMAGRMVDPADRAEAESLGRQASSFIDAWKQVRARGRGRMKE
ncbi:MAG: hypothetical protein WEB06_12880 [Actinomycetota bacterium]